MARARYGFVKDERKPEDYIFGSSQVPYAVLQEDGNWSDYLPDKEYQNLNGVEPYACVVFSTLNCLEALIYKKYGEKRNYADRFLAKMAEITPPGTSPQVVAEALRKKGVVKEEVWPFDASIDSFEKFYAPVPESVKKLAEEFNNEWVFKHSYVDSNPEAITQALKCSPLLISVTAWFENGRRYYRPKGMSDNHATTLFYERIGEFRRVFDSYADGVGDPAIKDVEWEAVPEVIKVFWIEKKAKVDEAKLNLAAQWLKLLSEWIAKIFADRAKNEVVEAPTSPATEAVSVPVPAKVSRIKDWARAIEAYEKAAVWRNNPGAIKGLDGKFLTFKTYDEGFAALCDYLTRACTGKHTAYKPEFTLLRFFQIYAPSTDNNNPAAYARFVAWRLGVDINIQIKELL